MNFGKLKQDLLNASFEDKQWRELKAICDIRQGNYSAKQGAETEVKAFLSKDYTDLFYDRLTNILLNECKVAVAPLGVLRRMQPKQYKLVKQAAVDLYVIACEWNPTKVRGRNFAIGIFHLYVKLVVEYLRDCKVPLSVKTCLQHTDKFVGLVDRAFPGYVAGGLIHIVVLGDRNELEAIA